MNYVKLGRTGLDVSKICCGCMSFGSARNERHPWALDIDGARPLIKAALAGGINFFDTANVYSDGASEKVVGQALQELAKREDVVIATKVFSRMRPGPNGGGLSRKAIVGELDASLRRLRTDYVDLYQIHRWDDETPIEETMEALHDCVKAGKVRYLGASSMWAWQFARANHVAELHRWTKFVSMQDHYNLLYREEEREMLPLCKADGIAVIPWSPLARGRLTRAWDDKTERSQRDQFVDKLYTPATEASDRAIVAAVADIATKRDVSRAQVALAWLLHKSEVTAPIVGIGKPVHLEDALASLELKLSSDELAQLESPYVPHPVAGLVIPPRKS